MAQFGPDQLKGGSIAAADTPFPVETEVTHREWGEGTVMSVENDRLTVLFEREGYRTLSLDAVQESGLLAARPSTTR